MNPWKLSASRSLWLVALCVVVIGVASATTFAQAPEAQPKLQPLVEEQPAANQPAAGQPKAAAPVRRAQDMSVDEQLRTCDKYLGQMKGMEGRTNQLVSKAEAKRDLIKLNCVKEKLLTIRTLLKLVGESRQKLKLAGAWSGDQERAYQERRHQFAKITVAYERATIAGQEAERCVGDELVYMGETQVIVDVDPTVDQAKDSSFDPDPLPTERQALASRTR